MTQKLNSRRKAILKVFKEMNGFEPHSKDDKYIVELLDKLKEIYDDNFEAIKRCTKSVHQKDLFEFKRKEEIINRFGILMQRWLKIYLRDSQIGGDDEFGKSGHPVASRGNSKVSD